MGMVQRATAEDGGEAQRHVEDLLMLFAVWLIEVRRLSPQTARAYVSTVRAWHERRFGAMAPGHEMVRLRAMLKGAKKLRVVRAPEHGRQAMPTQVLAKGIRELDDDDNGRCAAAALQLAFCGLLRVGEYTSPSQKHFDEKSLPTVRDVTFSTDEHGEMATIMIEAKKKGVKAAGKTSAVVVRDGTLLKPVKALKRMLRRRKATADEPLFLWNGKPLTANTVNKLVKFVAEAAGVPAANFSTHSLRIGGATAALVAGMSPEVIRVMGRWDSDVYRVYCRRSREVAMRLGAVIASTSFHNPEGAFVDEELI